MACVAVAAGLSLFASMPVAAQTSGDAKAKLVEHILTLWHPEDVVIVMVQRPAADAMQQARIALQGRVTAERKDAALKAIAVDVQKYIDEATPIAKESAKRQLQQTVAPMLMKEFSEDELKQIVAFLESPVKKKFDQMMPQMERALGEKVAEESRPQIDPKLKELTKSVGLKLRGATIGE
jgi:hypothetical protein